MTSHKRFLVTLGMLIFTALAVGLVFERSVTPVKAASSSVAVVTMRCSNFPSGLGGGVQYAESSDPAVTVPANNTSCAAALKMLNAQGFTVGQAFMPSDGIFEHVLVRQ
jgi:hypothetical protein